MLSAMSYGEYLYSLEFKLLVSVIRSIVVRQSGVVIVFCTSAARDVVFVVYDIIIGSNSSTSSFCFCNWNICECTRWFEDYYFECGVCSSSRRRGMQPLNELVCMLCHQTSGNESFPRAVASKVCLQSLTLVRSLRGRFSESEKTKLMHIQLSHNIERINVDLASLHIQEKADFGR